MFRRMSNEGDDEEQRCAICFEQVVEEGGEDVDRKIFKMPCCHKDSSSLLYCKMCINRLCSTDSGIGTCPTCGKFFVLDGEDSIKICTNVGHCRSCQQKRVSFTTSSV